MKLVREARASRVGTTHSEAVKERLHPMSRLRIDEVESSDDFFALKFATSVA